MKTETVRLEKRERYVGVAEAARRIGCSREHLSRVLHGQRKANQAIARSLAKFGLNVKEG